MENTETALLADAEHGSSLDRRISVAPMMDWTDRHCRYFLRGFSPRVLLYTEMITAAAIVHGQRERLLRYDAAEHPVALQLGGSDPAQLAFAARVGAEFGYDEINLNCGCPSDRVQAGAFGACLMREPQLVAECVAAMRAAVALPVTVKMRIGVVSGAHARTDVAAFTDEDYARLHAFTGQIAAAGCQHVVVHARKAVLGGLSPRENREVPPLRFDVVARLKRDYPSLTVVVNGGLRTAAQCEEALNWADGVMLGREAYHHPQVLAELHQHLYTDDWVCPPLPQLLERMSAYAQQQVAQGERLSTITRHMLGLLTGRPGARRFRVLLSHGARTAVDAAGTPQGVAELFASAATLCAA